MKTSFAVAALAASVNAFWGTGHLLVARRAQSLLEGSNALTEALDVLTYLKESEASLTNDEDSHPFTECATFADNIKGQGFSYQSDWHFIDQPYLSDGDTIEDYPDYKMSDTDIVAALTDLTAFLKGETVSDDSAYLSQIKESFSDVNDQKSFALRLVIHYVGDIHQPLHAVSEVNSVYPKGDRGGNSEWIDGDVGGVQNLHGVWDSVVYEFTGYPTLPMSDDAWTTITGQAETLSTTYPIPSDKVLGGEFSTWAAESLEIAKEWVYADFVNHEIPSDDYDTTRRPILEERVMYAGVRLATLIEDIYSSTAVAEEFLQ